MFDGALCPQKPYGLLGTGKARGRGGGVGYMSAPRPVKTEETVSHRQNSNVKEVARQSIQL